MFVKLTSRHGVKDVFVNLDHILKMHRTEDRTTVLTMPNGGEIIVYEKPEDINAMVSPIVTISSGNDSWVPDLAPTVNDPSALDEGRAKWMYGYYRSALWSRTCHSLVKWDDLLPTEQASWVEVAKNYKEK